MLKQLDDVGRVTWATRVKQLLYTYGFGYIWLSQDVGDAQAFVYTFRCRLTDCMRQNWNASINDSSRCDTYKHFKSQLDVEKYISVDIPFFLRKAFARFRCSNHKLKIETGRHDGIIREARICDFCHLHSNILVIENEYHAFFCCPKYSDLRIQLLASWYTRGDSEVDFYRLMACTEITTIRSIAKFIYCILKRMDANL